MCLLPGMMDNPSQYATPAAKDHQCRLYILVLFHFALGIMLTVASPQIGFMDIIIPFILLCTAYSMNFCTLMFYIILIINDLVTYVCAVGLAVQRGSFLSYYQNPDNDNYNPFLMTVLIMWVVFSLVSLIVSFYAYREFKGMAYDQMGMQGGAIYGGMMRGMNRNRGPNNTGAGRDQDEEVAYGQPLMNQQQQNNNQNNNYQNQNPSNAANNQEQQNNRAQDATSANRNRSGGFVPFSGQGVRIG
ncbi:UNKNOWN [Stylonychia lemnae]|uniref:Uncharacterized protein n=1 Tax=Stylonychia lemnae TaxID=5949 RepID=A0A077ZXN7_STYLE|nr:UNKNOWN [Stylonychia lemnae]|eukprot:CDW74675.1 UNKNOWN [Stylonychia lemnae]